MESQLHWWTRISIARRPDFGRTSRLLVLLFEHEPRVRAAFGGSAAGRHSQCMLPRHLLFRENTRLREILLIMYVLIGTMSHLQRKK